MPPSPPFRSGMTSHVPSSEVYGTRAPELQSPAEDPGHIVVWPGSHDAFTLCHDELMSPTQTARSRVSARIGGITPSATLAVDAKARELKAAGHPVIAFGAGEP